MLNFIKFSLICIIIPILLSSCSGFKRSETAKNQPTNANERIKKNIKEGRGLRLSSSMTMGNAGGGTFLFASSNALWRATLEKLDFIPLANVDYAGGVIITDWYGDTQSNEEIKVAVRFLTNEIRSDALDVVIYKKICVESNRCTTSKVENNTNTEIKTSILKRAAALSKEAESKKDD
jgi:hypothetical protein